MAKKKTASKARRRPGGAAKSRRSGGRRRSVRTAGFAVSPMAIALGIGGAVAAPLLLNKLPIEDARIRNGLGAVAGLLGAKMAAKQMPELVPAFVGFGIGSGVMLAADLFPEMGKRIGLPQGGGAKSIGRLNQSELDRIRQAVREQVKIQGSGMPVIQGIGVPVIAGLPDVNSSFT